MLRLAFSSSLRGILILTLGFLDLVSKKYIVSTVITNNNSNIVNIDTINIVMVGSAFGSRRTLSIVALKFSKNVAALRKLSLKASPPFFATLS